MNTIRKTLAHEWTKNAFAILIVSVTLGTIAFVGLFRPALVVGVDGDALARSLERKTNSEFANCVDRGDGHWTCQISAANGEFGLAVDRFGCWSGEWLTKGPASARPHSACIGFSDVWGENRSKGEDD